ncbi:sulfurtransferase [Vibrio vulnificus]|uniref:sulfurtransferase n=1 Tax=Vibrio vulnificus TaxID=672 RepID=UPI001CDD85F6|nr:sulfurtransferase [Vibrio vulnificus]MCA3891135.1 sulfurtransferase [Vibrio vulnificus]MCA3955068.1 sulfurtransferase [Vibrio vulnificus]
MSPLISASELNEIKHQKNLVILDASMEFTIPNAEPKIFGKVIPGARRFDYDHEFCDLSSTLPHMMPDQATFNAKAQHIGLNNDSHIVVYDNAGTYASPRAWWMLKAMGHHNVQVLNGGLKAWIDAGFETQDNFEAVSQIGTFNGQIDPDYFLNADIVLKHSNLRSASIVDARSMERFLAQVPEPREGIRSGHIPGSLCLPFSQLMDKGHIKPLSGLQEAFEPLPLEQSKPIIFSCGSGVTACILLLGAYLIGYKNLSVYDGSWTEWGANPQLPIEP